VPCLTACKPFTEAANAGITWQTRQGRTVTRCEPANLLTVSPACSRRSAWSVASPHARACSRSPSARGGVEGCRGRGGAPRRNASARSSTHLHSPLVREPSNWRYSEKN
jgi:hypothetical protein